MNVIEVCPHCDNKINCMNVSDNMDSQMTTICDKCGKVIVLCEKCANIVGDSNADGHKCDSCPFCDLANFMNYLKGFCTIPQLLESLVPPLSDMTTGLPDGVSSVTLDDYINDTFGDDVIWDVKYWDIYKMVNECFLNSESSEADCRDFVEQLIIKNRE